MLSRPISNTTTFLAIEAAARKELRYALSEVRNVLPPRAPATRIEWDQISTSEAEATVRQAISVASNQFKWYKPGFTR